MIAGTRNRHKVAIVGLYASGMVEQSLTVLTNGETYRRILYLLLAFPLGTVYFTLIITGLAQDDLVSCPKGQPTPHH